MDIPSWCRVGQKVVVKNTIRPFAWDTAKGVMEGDTYTIREVYVSSRLKIVGIRLVEIRNPIQMTQDGMVEQVYNIVNFAPLTDTKFESDISMFKDIMLHAYEYRDITEHV